MFKIGNVRYLLVAQKRASPMRFAILSVLVCEFFSTLVFIENLLSRIYFSPDIVERIRWTRIKFLVIIFSIIAIVFPKM